MARANTERRSIWRVGPESTWTTVLPVAFIIVSLVSLAVLPIVVSKRTARMRQEISVAERARRVANQIQMDLAGELDQLISFQVTGQSQYRNHYEQLLTDQSHATQQLRVLAPKLGSDVDHDLATLVAATTAWHNAVTQSELTSRSLPPEVFVTRLFERHPKYEQLMAAASGLEVGIQDAMADRLQSIRQADSVNYTLTIILTLLALTSALLVAGLGRQMRLLAREAMRRRQEAEREAADAKSARATAEREERRAAFVANAGQELTASLDYDQTIARLARLIVPNIADAAVVDIADANSLLRRAAVAHRDPASEERLAARVGQVSEQVPEAVVRVMQDREVKIIGAAAPLTDYFDGSDAGGSRSMMAVPLVSRGQTLGVSVMAAPEGRVFTREDAQLAEELARHASLAIDNARLYLESQQAVHAREEVLAIVSHDLRNPLNAIMLGSSLMQLSENLTAEDRDQVEVIGVSARRMRALIEDLLDVTRLEGGKQLPIDPAPTDVESLFREAYELFKAQAASSGVTFHYSIADDVPRVYADRHRVMQVVSNLIGNAMKFTPAGGMISYRADRRDEGQVLVTVADTGPGIPNENIDKIFNPYWQAKRTARLGAGLGLPIAKGIVESHGGTIWVESEPGAGTKFFFTLRVPREEAPADAATRGEESATRR